MQIVLIGAFGAAGVLSRYFIDLFFAGKAGAGFPISTFTINCVGSFLIGLVFALGHQKNLLSPQMTLALTVGFLGGFTTFSAYSMQTLELLQAKRYDVVLLYFVGTPVLGLAFAFLGLFVGSRSLPLGHSP